MTACHIETITDRLACQAELEMLLEEEPQPAPGSWTEQRVRELSLALQDYAARRLLRPCGLADGEEWF